jgi:cardiolipin synthase
MYELKDTMITTLLTTAAKNGIKVRVILDTNLEMKENTTAYDALNAGGVSVHWANTAYSATHQKTITVDAATSAIMSLNLASEYYSTTRDFAIITDDANDVSAIETTFADDFASTAIAPPNGDDLVWSPTNSQASLLALINGATSTLLIENEEMSYDTIVAALTSAAQRKVDVQIVMTASASWDQNFTALTAVGVKVVTYASNASLYIHAKVIVADYGKTSASVFVGSENFSDASLTRNRELGIVTKDAAIMKAVNGTLTSDFNGGTPFQ